MNWKPDHNILKWQLTDCHSLTYTRREQYDWWILLRRLCWACLCVFVGLSILHRHYSQNTCVRSVRLDVLVNIIVIIILLTSGSLQFACVCVSMLLLMVVFKRPEKNQQRNTRIYISFVRYTYAMYVIANLSDSKYNICRRSSSSSDSYDSSAGFYKIIL